MKPQIGKIILLITSLTLLSGIGRHDVKEEKYQKLAKQKQFECVGQVYIDTAAIGSCVLICENTVLSAAHVFIESDTRPDTMEMNGQQIIAYVPYNERVVDAKKVSIEINGEKRKVKRISIHPNYLDSIMNGFCDIALIELEQSVKNIEPAILNQYQNELNTEVTGVGFGVSGTADKPEDVERKGSKRAGENDLDSIGGQVYEGKATLLFCDFDHPSRLDVNKMGSTKPKALEYICSGGDSGGGLFHKRNNKWELIGICSGANFNMEQFNKSGYYGQIMEWTRVSAFTDWINKQLNLPE